MKANELMLGNYVEMLGNDGVWYADKVGYRDIETIFLYPKNTCYKPIALTEGWLQKLGCTELPDNAWFIDRFKLRWIEAYKYWYVTDINTKLYITKVEFVHEWQNAFFVLNGEELTIKQTTNSTDQ